GSSTKCASRPQPITGLKIPIQICRRSALPALARLAATTQGHGCLRLLAMRWRTTSASSPAATGLRFGLHTNINRAHQQRESNIQGRYDFETRVNNGVIVADSVSNYINQRPRRFRQTVAVNPDDLIFRGTQKELAFFARDQVALTPALTLNFGLRWEGQ